MQEQDILIRMVVPYLHNLGFGALKLEQPFGVGARHFVADAVVYSRDEKPNILVELKRDLEDLGEDVDVYHPVVRQTYRQALTAETPYFVLTDGLKFYWFALDWEQGTFRHLQSPPSLAANGRQLLPLESAEEVDRLFFLLFDVMRNQLSTEDIAAAIVQLFLIKVYDEIRHTTGEASLFSVQTGDTGAVLLERLKTVSGDNSRNEPVDRLKGDALQAAVTLIEPVSLLRSNRELLDRGLYRIAMRIGGELREGRLKKRQRPAVDDYFPPPDIANFMVGLAEVGVDDQVLDLACGIGMLLTAAITIQRKPSHEDTWNSSVFGITANEWLAQFARLRLIFFGGEPDNVFVANPLQAETVKALGLPDTFDVVVTVPPIGNVADEEVLHAYELAGPGRTAGEVLYIEQSFQMLKPGGRLVLLVPESLLYLERFKRVRRWLVEHLRIDAIVKLGSEAGKSFGIVSQAILKATKTTAQDHDVFIAWLQSEPAQREERQVRLEDVADAFVAFRSGEIKSDVGWHVPQASLGEDWSIALQGPEYLRLRDSLFALPLPTVPLGRIADIRVGRGIRVKQNTEEGAIVVRGRHIQGGVLDLDRADRVEAPTSSAGVFLESGDLILPVLSRYPIAVLVQNIDSPTIVDSSVARIRLRNESLTSGFLQFLFTTDLIQHQITSTASRLGELSRITRSLLENVLVPVPSLATQREIVDQLHKAEQLRAEADAIERSIRTNLLQRLQGLN